MQVSVVLPALNEAENLKVLIPDIQSAMADLGWEYEIIVVNDGSTDGTRELLERLSLPDPRIKTIQHSQNQGYGRALQSGFSMASYTWIFFTDADRQFDIREIQNLAVFGETFDYIAGYRVQRRDHRMRIFNAWLFHLAVRILFGVHLKDIDCAFKLIRREVIQSAHLTSEGAFINTELLIRTQQHGYRIREVPVSHYPRQHGNPTGASPKVIVRAMKEVLRFKFHEIFS